MGYVHWHNCNILQCYILGCSLYTIYIPKALFWGLLLFYVGTIVLWHDKENQPEICIAPEYDLNPGKFFIYLLSALRR